MHRDLTSSLLQRQLLTLDATDHRTLAQATVAIAGLGGIGCPAMEVLARNAVGAFVLADIDCFDATNARQLYMTQATIGLPKVAVSCERLLAINPRASVRTFSDGITPANYAAVCLGADVICNQVDQLAAIMILHYAGARFRIPVVSASRTCWPERHFLGVKIYDYRDPDMQYDMRGIAIEQRWGVEPKLVEALMDYVTREQDCPELVAEINAQNTQFRAVRMLEAIQRQETEGISDKSPAYLHGVAHAHPEVFHKMAIAPEEALVMGCLAGTAVKDILLGRETGHFEVNLYHGTARIHDRTEAMAYHDMACSAVKAVPA